ncbi:MAG: hypothetical protein E3J72_11155 [Planctomycetota bacterium]|nr:MAG: hypothetical protein E3J72_11155 [Planctomycetota bacterium]
MEKTLSENRCRGGVRRAISGKFVIVPLLFVVLFSFAECKRKKSKKYFFTPPFPPSNAIAYWSFDNDTGGFVGIGPGSVSFGVSGDSPYRGDGCLKHIYTDTENQGHFIGAPLSLANATEDIRFEFRIKVSHPGTYHMLVGEADTYDYIASFRVNSTAWEKISFQSVQLFQDIEGKPVDPSRKFEGNLISSLAIVDLSGVFYFKDLGEKFMCIDDLLILPDSGAPVKISDKTFFKNMPVGKIGMYPYPAYDDPMPNNTLEALKRFVEAGCQFGMLDASWTEHETAPMTYDFESMKLLNEYFDRNIPQYRSRTEFSYRVLVINMNFLEALPPDLAGAAFDNAMVVSRYVSFVKEFLNASGVGAGEEFYFFVGNEVDTYFEINESEIDSFKNFYGQVKTALKLDYPNMLIGVITKYHGARPDIIASVNEWSDVVAYTFYGFGAGFSFGNMGALDTVFAGMVASAGGRPVVITEIGYATSPVLDSDEAGQAAYVAEMFREYPKYRDSIPALLYWIQGDFGDDFFQYLMESFFPGLIGNAEFEAYLQYLGLYKFDGTPKKAVSSWISGMNSYYLRY